MKEVSVVLYRAQGAPSGGSIEHSMVRVALQTYTLYPLMMPFFTDGSSQYAFILDSFRQSISRFNTSLGAANTEKIAYEYMVGGKHTECIECTLVYCTCTG